MKPILLIAVLGGWFAAAASPAATNNPPLLGFDTDSSTRQRGLEAKFDASLRRENLIDWMRRLSARPHHLGSPYDHTNALFIAEQFRSWGYDTRIEQFDVLFPTPRTRLVELTEPHHFTATLAEPPIPEDATSGLTAEQLPIYHAYSVDGDVTGKLVYVNYGLPKDYELLAERGINVTGRVVIARYGASWRGVKPKVAAEHGALGCLIYSDPRDDGYFRGDVYPKGSWRNDQGAQRGSVADTPSTRGTRSRRAWAPPKTPSDFPSVRPAPSPRSPCCPSATPTPCPSCAPSRGPLPRKRGGAHCR